MFRSSLQGWRSFTRTLTYATPLILTGLAAAVAFKMRRLQHRRRGPALRRRDRRVGAGARTSRGHAQGGHGDDRHRRRGDRRCGVGTAGGRPQGGVRHRRGHHDAHAQLHRPRPDELPDPGVAVVLEEPDPPGSPGQGHPGVGPAAGPVRAPARRVLHRHRRRRRRVAGDAVDVVGLSGARRSATRRGRHATPASASGR